MSSVIDNKKIKSNILSIYLKMIDILKELNNAGIVYSDIHDKNFMININNFNIKLIDFDSSLIDFDENMKYLYGSMINNLKNMIKKINSCYRISFLDNFDKVNDLAEISECVKEKQYILSIK